MPVFVKPLTTKSIEPWVISIAAAFPLTPLKASNICWALLLICEVLPSISLVTVLNCSAVTSKYVLLIPDTLSLAADIATCSAFCIIAVLALSVNNNPPSVKVLTTFSDTCSCTSLTILSLNVPR